MSGRILAAWLRPPDATRTEDEPPNTAPSRIPWVGERAVGAVVVHLAVYVLLALAVVADYGRERLADGAVSGAVSVGAESRA